MIRLSRLPGGLCPTHPGLLRLLDPRSIKLIFKREISD